MRALFIGLGSIGTRHLKNLAALCKKQELTLEAHAVRSTNRELAPEVAALIAQSYTSLPPYEYYDVVFITNPTNLHFEAIRLVADKTKALFIEKPLFESTEYSLEQLNLPENLRCYIAAPMRWCAVFAKLKQALGQVKPIAVRSLCSSYLPSWRPAADYRQLYSAKKEMGGGVTLDLIHEWDYLCALFGFPQRSINMRGTFSNLEIDSDDLSVYIARYESFLLELHLDYFGREYRREVEIFTNEGLLKADFGNNTLLLPNGEIIDCAEDVNCRYEREMEYFISYAQGKTDESLNSPQHALEVMRVALGS